MYEFAEGVRFDPEKAVYYYKKGFENDHLECTYNLGCIYEKGKGCIEQDYKKAQSYYLAASKRHHVKAIYNLGKLYFFFLKNFFKRMFNKRW
jgi:uncharacterized protein